MTRPHHPTPIADDHGWLITPRALTSLATAVGLVYTLHAPVRYVLRMSATLDTLTARVASLEAQIDHQRGTIVAAELMIAEREKRQRVESPETGSRSADAVPRHRPDRGQLAR